jgi:hypothetical protein
MVRHEIQGGVNASLAWTGLALGALVPVVVALPVGSLVKTLAVLAFACFGPGPALLCHVRLGIAAVSWTMSFVMSISLFALLSAVMVWTSYWHPFDAFYVLAAVSVVSALLGIGATFLRQTQTGRKIAARAENPPPAGPRAHQPLSTETTVMPAIRSDTAEAPAESSAMTTIMPAVPDLVVSRPPSVDATAVMPRQQNGHEGDATQIFQRITDAGATAVIHMPATAPAPVPISPATAVRLPKSLGAYGPLAAQVTLLVAATACWVTSLALSSTAGVGDYGLLAVMHPTFFAGLALCVVGFLVEISRGARRGWLLIANLALLLLIMHATVPVLVHEPEYAWTYKHIGVIQLFRVTGHVVNPADIYEAWPTLFSSVAMLGTLSGASSLRIAVWGPLFFDAANALPVFAIVRTLTNDRRLPYLTVFVFTCVNWVAQDYLSPQAFAYVLCLGALLIMVRWLRRRPGPHGIRIRLVARLWTRLQIGMNAVPYVGKRAERTALVCLYLVYGVVVITHQLSPYLIALSATALVVLGLIRTWQVIPILLGIAFLYLLPHYGIADHYGLFDGVNIFANILQSIHGVAPTTEGISSGGQVFSAEVVQLLSLALWGGAAVAVMTSRTRLGPVALPAVLAFAPFALLLGQNYGGEAIYRVYLFSTPWCAYLVCRMALRARQMPKVVGLVAASVLVSAAALVGIQGEHGQLSFDQFTPTEVAATQFVYTQAPIGSTILTAAPNLPARLTERYVDFNGASDPDTLMPVLPLNSATITPVDMQKIIDFCNSYQSTVFVIITNSMTTYVHYFGYLPDGLLGSLQRAMDASPVWKAEYRSKDAVVYRFMN